MVLRMFMVKIHKRVLSALILASVLLLATCPWRCWGQGRADYNALMAFKATAGDSRNVLSSWSHRNPCKRRWFGVGCENGRVVRLVLEDLGLSGNLDALKGLQELRILSLKRNAFKGSLPNFSDWTSIRLLFLSYNHFRGPLPSSISSMDRLVRLDVSNNLLSGQIPESIASLSNLLTLRLDNNGFSGSISELMLPTSLEEFNVSGNGLTGMIPASLSKFPSSAFQNNGGLCGMPLQSCENVSGLVDNTRPHVAPTPPDIPSRKSNNPNSRSSSSQLSKADVSAIVVGDIAVLCLIATVLFCYCWKTREHARKLQKAKEDAHDGVLQAERGGVGSVYCSNHFTGSSNSSCCEEKCRLVFFDQGRPFELENLLRASAEMLGKGNFGSAYKAVMEDGSVVAVKRLKDVHGIGRKEFEQCMDQMGKLRHPNVLNLKAYYYAKDEKLLVYDYMPNGSLQSLLHGCRGPGRTPLDWTSRLKIALEAARGLAFIHGHCKSHKTGHGNIKSSNILLDRNGCARVSDFGIAMMVSPAVAALRMAGYRAPEQAAASASRKITHKADVYSFGVLLLELLTGKTPCNSSQDESIDLPRWVQSIVKEEWTSEVFDIELMRFKNIEEELVSMLHIALLCASEAPQQRPKMSHVVRMIQDIRGAREGQGFSALHSPSPCLNDQIPEAITDSPSVSDDSGTRSL